MKLSEKSTMCLEKNKTIFRNYLSRSQRAYNNNNLNAKEVWSGNTGSPLLSKLGCEPRPCLQVASLSFLASLAAFIDNVSRRKT